MLGFFVLEGNAAETYDGSAAFFPVNDLD